MFQHLQSTYHRHSKDEQGKKERENGTDFHTQNMQN